MKGIYPTCKWEIPYSKGSFPLQTGSEKIGERKLAAIMFTDIVGYTALTERNESLSFNILKEYRDTLRYSFGRFDAREIETVGDGTLSEFPSSLQAVQCAYEIQSTFSQINNLRDESSRIMVRVGIHIGDVIHTDDAVFGDAVNIASRIQSICEPGGICISEEIYHQVQNKVTFAFESVGEQRLKNVERPIEIFKVVHSKSIHPTQQQIYRARDRFFDRELPFTDRILETEELRALLDKTLATKQGSLVFIFGEPGIGKTRLANEIKEHAIQKNFSWLSTACSRTEDTIPYSPWIQLLREFANKAPISTFYKICGSHISQIVRLIPELTESGGVIPFTPSSIRDPSQEADMEAFERRQFFQALAQFFVNLSKETSGLVLHFDDLQWADYTTLQLLKFFISSTVSNERIVILASYREIEAKSGENSAVAKFLKEMDYERKGIRIELKRFGESDVGKLLASLSGQRDVSYEFTDLIYSKTGGNPFFIGELMKSLYEKHDIFADERGLMDRKPIEEIEVPASVRSLLQERVARLDIDTQKILKEASVIGDSFDFEILQEAVQDSLSEDRLILALERALASGFILERNEDRIMKPTKFGSHFVFADESIRDVLQDELDNQLKVSTHLKTALALEKIGMFSPSFKSENAAAIAYHYLGSGEKLKALEYGTIAGDRSASLFAHEEAIKHYSLAVELAKDEESKPRLLRSLGDETWLIGHAQKALGYWIESAQAYERAGDNRTASDLYRRIAFTYHTPFLDKSNSILYINKAIDLLERNGQRGWELAAAYLNAALVYSWDGQVVKAKQLFEDGLHLAKSCHSRFIESVAAYTSFFIADIEEKDKVLRDCEDAIEYLADMSNIRQASFAHASRAGWYALVKGASQETLRIFLDAISYAEKVGVNTAILAIKASLSVNVDLPLGRFEEAKKIAEQLGSIAGTSPSLLTIKCYALQALGLLQFYLGDLPESRKTITEVIKISNGFGNSSLAIQPYTVVARSYMLEGNFMQADEFVVQGLELSEKRKKLLSNVACHLELLSLQLELGIKSKAKSLKESLDILAEMKNISQEIEEPWASAYCLRSEGLLALNQLELERAIRLLAESGEIWERLGWLYEQARIKCEIATCYQRLGDKTNSREHNREALELYSALGAKLDIEKCIALDSDLKADFDLPKILHQSSRMTFDYLVTSFLDDNSIKNLNPQSSGWRTLKDIAKHTGVPASSLYFRAFSGSSDSTLHNLLASKLIESKTFRGERGRGGEVTRYRIGYDREEVRDYADRLVHSKSEMLH